MTQRTFTMFCLLLGLLSCGSLAFAAPSDPVTVYLHARRVLPSPPLTQSLLAYAQVNPAEYRAHVFEVTASVAGLVTAEGERTILLTIPGGSLTAHVPPALRDAGWIDSGCTLRALVRVENTGNDTSLSHLTMLAAAPEAGVAEAERTALAAMRARRVAASYPSRSMAYGSRRGDPSAYATSYSVGATGAAPVAALPPRAQAIYAPYRAAIRNLNPRLSDHDVDIITTWVLYFSDQYNIDPRLAVAMIIAESGFDPSSTSRTGAMGLGQLMPSTAAGMGVTDAYDPVQNIGAAVRLLRGHLDKYGGAPVDAQGNPASIPFEQIALTMAAYNAGPGAVRKYHGVPPYKETKRYVARVASLYKQMCGGD